jgi:hypothetical protein
MEFMIEEHCIFHFSYLGEAPMVPFLIFGLFFLHKSFASEEKDFRIITSNLWLSYNEIKTSSSSRRLNYYRAQFYKNHQLLQNNYRMDKIFEFLCNEHQNHLNFLFLFFLNFNNSPLDDFLDFEKIYSASSNSFQFDFIVEDTFNRINYILFKILASYQFDDFYYPCALHNSINERYVRYWNRFAHSFAHKGQAFIPVIEHQFERCKEYRDLEKLFDKRLRSFVLDFPVFSRSGEASV